MSATLQPATLPASAGRLEMEVPLRLHEAGLRAALEGAPGLRVRAAPGCEDVLCVLLRDVDGSLGGAPPRSELQGLVRLARVQCPGGCALSATLMERQPR